MRFDAIIAHESPKRAHPYGFTIWGVLFFSAIGIIVGLICGIGGTRHIYQRAEAIQQTINYKRSLDGLPIKINDAEFNCRLRISGMNQAGKYQSF